MKNSFYDPNKSLKEHLVQRGMNLDIHNVWINEDDVVATFPLFHLNGRLIGYQKYQPKFDKVAKNNPHDGKYFTRIPRTEACVWGLESWNFSDTLFITEGIFDACRLTNIGYSACAMLSYNPSNMKNWLFCIRQHRKVVAICDYGQSGLKLKKYGHEFHVMEENFDLGDAPDSYVENLAKKFAA